MLPLMPCFSTAESNSCLEILSNLPEGKIKLLAFSGKGKENKNTCALSGRWVLNVTRGGNSRTGIRSHWFIEEQTHKTRRPPRGFVPLRCRGAGGAAGAGPGAGAQGAVTAPHRLRSFAASSVSF